MPFRSKAAVMIAAALAIAGVLLAGCGSSDSETSSAEFSLVSDAMPGYEDLAGEATLERSQDEGTDAALELSGLEPDTEYLAHLHVGYCDQPDPGGPHFKFDRNGSDMPPNEVHLTFTSDAEGAGAAEAQNEREVPDGEVNSMVVHLANKEDMPQGMTNADGHSGHFHPPKIACAPLETGE